MPYKKITKKPIKKTYKKVPKKSLTTVPRNMISVGKGFPKKLCMTHKYVDVTSVTSTSGLLGKYLFSCNSMYDPNWTGGGHQPMYRDQCAALYQHYNVIGSRAKFKILNGATNTGLIAVSLYINDDATVTPTDISTVTEQTSATPMKLIAYNSSDPVYLTKSWSAKKFFGKGVLANNAIGAGIGSNPTEQSFFTLCLQCMDGLSTVSVYFEVEIEYICVWTELIDIGSS